MRMVLIYLISMVLFSGCITSPAQDDIINNEYDDVKIYADASAMYVGEWVGGADSTLMPLKITKHGTILMCVTRKNIGNSNGKVYIQDGQTMFIFQGGTKYRLVTVNDKYMILDYYGQEATYYKGIVPDKCVDAFKKFE